MYKQNFNNQGFNFYIICMHWEYLPKIIINTKKKKFYSTQLKKKKKYLNI